MAEGWNNIKLKDLMSAPIRNGLTKPTAVRGEGVKMIGMKEIFAYDRIGDVSMDLVPVTEKELNSCKIEVGDLLFARQSLVLEGAGKCSIVTEVSENTVFESHLIRLRINENKVLAKYVYYYFKSSSGRSAILSLVEQVAAAGIRGKELIELYVPVPPIDVQNKIVKILDDLDTKIEIDEKIKQNLYEQALTVYRNEFEQSGDKYEERKLGEVTSQITGRIGKNDNRTVLSAINTGILKPSDEYFTKRVYSKDISKYIAVDEGDFAYNPARINIGSIGINDLGFAGCVSPVYVVFSVDPAYQSFFKFYFRSKLFNEECNTRASGSVRQTLNYKDFSEIPIRFPSEPSASRFNTFWKKNKKWLDDIDKEILNLGSIRNLLVDYLIKP